jgi:hypothetical protein
LATPPRRQALPSAGGLTTSILTAACQPRAWRQPDRASDERQDYDNYLAWRTANGFTARFDEMLAQPMAIRYFDEAQPW